MEDRQFFPFMHTPFMHTPFFHQPFMHTFPFFFRPRLFPFFFISPFHRPFFFRDEEERDGKFMQHECVDGDTIERLADRYNVPHPMLMELNAHLQNPSMLNPGDVLYIPRLNKMYCQRMYMADESMAEGVHGPMGQPGMPNYMGGPQMPMQGFPQYPQHPQTPMGGSMYPGM